MKALAAMGFALTVMASCAPPTKDVDGDHYGARSVCETFVERQLKSPGSAEYSDQNETQKGRVWTATGTVDSQNSFGALIRNTYTCVVRYEGGVDENYRLISLDGLVN